MSDCCNDFEFVGQQNSFDMAGGIRGSDGTTFYPHVSADGVLSWTNDGGKLNPAPVNIKGADGTPGKSAYAAAQEAGFTGTEAEFNAYLSGIGDLADEVADQKSALMPYNATDVIVQIAKYASSGTSAGVTYTWSEDHKSCTVNGTRNGGVSFRNIIAGTTAIPDGIIPGKTYWVFFETTDPNLVLEMLPIGVGSGKSTYIAEPQTYTVPMGITGFTIRLRFRGEHAENAIASNWSMLTMPSNEDLSNHITGLETVVSKTIALVNLYTDDGMTYGQYLNTSGTPAAYDSSAFTGYIPVIGGESATFSCHYAGSGSFAIRAFAYTDDRTQISRVLESGTISGDERDLSYSFDVPENAAFIRISIGVNWTISDRVLTQLGAITADDSFSREHIGATDMAADNYQITTMCFDATTHALTNMTTGEAIKCIVVPIAPNTTYKVTSRVSGTHRALGTFPRANYGDVPTVFSSPDGQVRYVIITSGPDDRFMVAQFFTEADANKDIQRYLANLQIEVVGAIDVIGRGYALQTLGDLQEQSRAFRCESLKDIPIHDNTSDFVVDGYDDSDSFHALCADLCNTSGGRLTQTLMGQSASGKNLYYYRYAPPAISYRNDRGSSGVSATTNNGQAITPTRIILTSNVHFFEKRGNYAVYNMLRLMLQNPQNDALKWLRRNAEIVWIPCGCPDSNSSGIAADGTPSGYRNAAGQNINRSFPSTADGQCIDQDTNSPGYGTICVEAELIKTVLDQYAPNATVHVDIHQFHRATPSASGLEGWLFSDSSVFGLRGAVAANGVIDSYHLAHPAANSFKGIYGAAVNTSGTITNYTWKVYGVPGGTIETAMTLPDVISASDNSMPVALSYDMALHITAAICD